MAAARMMLLKNGNPFPLHLLLRGPACGVSSNINMETKLLSIADPRFLQLHHQAPVFGNASNICGGVAHGYNLRISGFGEMGRFELHGNKKKVVKDEVFEDEDWEDDDENVEEDFKDWEEEEEEEEDEDDHRRWGKGRSDDSRRGKGRSDDW